MTGLLQSSALHTAVGFVLMGSWAWFANRTYDWPAPLVAALVQGAITATITYALKRAIEAVSARTKGRARYVLPPLVAALISALVLTSLHALAGTPALLATISVPFSVASIYAVIYSATLVKGQST